ncbi:MAG: BamA/TamA family outer membrane protein, partial [Deltaproteobacteria bacterium]|nr:BamA/TamA family outer membrane protein [Deltaproteobacteria bacterium]
NPLEHVKRVLLDHGYFVRSGRLIENTPGYIFSVDDVQILSIKEIKLLNLQGMDIPQNLLNKLQSFINARASRETILEIVKKIERTQIFKVIEYNFDQKSGELKIVLSYEPKNSLKFGLGYHSELGIHLSTFFSNQIFFEQGETLFGKLDLFFKEDLSFVQSGSASVSYIDPLVDFDNFQIESFGIYQRTKQSDLPFNFERYTASIGLNRVGTYSVKPTIGLTQDLVFDVASDLYSSDTNIFSPFIGLEFRKENIDNYAFPTSGYSFRAQLKLGTADVNYAEIKSSLTKFLSLSKNLVFDLSLKYQEIMSNKEVPLPYRYFVGGRDSLRGYKLFKLGEKGDQGSPLGGTRFVGSQVELNWIFYDPLALVVFTDFGGIDNLERDELGIGSGLGVRYLSPVGPVGLEVARGIYKNDSRRDLAFYFNLGISF